MYINNCFFFFYKKMRTDSLIILWVRKSSYESNSRGKPSKYLLQIIVFYKKMVYVKNTVRWQMIAQRKGGLTKAIMCARSLILRGRHTITLFKIYYSMFTDKSNHFNKNNQTISITTIKQRDLCWDYLIYYLSSCEMLPSHMFTNKKLNVWT